MDQLSRRILAGCLILMVALFAFASTSEAYRNELPAVLPVQEGPQCTLSSLVQIDSSLNVQPELAVSSSPTIVCESPHFYTPIQAQTKDFAPAPLVCGGEPGTQINSTIILNGDQANFSPLSATFDQEGCADLSDVFSQTGEPLAPTALKLVHFSAESPLSWFNTTAGMGVFVFFVLVTGGWLWMLRGEKNDFP